MISFARRRLGVLALAATVSSVTPVFGQTFELGAAGGFGSAGVSGEGVGGAFAGVGADFCAFCSNRFAIFAEYRHLQRASALSEPGTAPICFGDRGFVPCRPSGITDFDIWGGGLRIQGTSTRVRPFFDVGFGTGRARFFPTSFVTEETMSHTIHGMLFGAGATVPVGQRWYLRPQVRGFWMSISHVGIDAGLAAGIRF